VPIGKRIRQEPAAPLGGARGHAISYTEWSAWG